ncbi:aspartyl-phosphate phosphatase Spo0E family protein [Metabacillus litoralis]|uniref:aspartyl-phosphate phosphatase Spo0E family protein n=1 Tax=Metabacillus litoralis TaxID=152268 RepID=UPI00203ACA76|nr:aspartyl-phosphate phosphatase Spo0E family protein [Metabacillus litoralis]
MLKKDIEKLSMRKYMHSRRKESCYRCVFVEGDKEKLVQKIEAARQNLFYTAQAFGFLDEKTIMKSHELDQLIVVYQKCTCLKVS